MDIGDYCAILKKELHYDGEIDIKKISARSIPSLSSGILHLGDYILQLEKGGLVPKDMRKLEERHKHDLAAILGNLKHGIPETLNSHEYAGLEAFLIRRIDDSERMLSRLGSSKTVYEDAIKSYIGPAESERKDLAYMLMADAMGINHQFAVKNKNSNFEDMISCAKYLHLHKRYALWFDMLDGMRNLFQKAYSN